MLCRSLFVSFLKSIDIYVLDLLYHEWHPLWQIQTFGHSIVCPSIYSFVFLLISHDYSLFPLLYPLIAPLMSSSYSLFSDYPFVIFWSHCWYLQTTPLVSSDYKESNMSRIFFVNVWRKNIFDIYVTEYGTALTTILPILFLYLNTVTLTAGTFEP